MHTQTGLPFTFERRQILCEKNSLLVPEVHSQRYSYKIWESLVMISVLALFEKIIKEECKKDVYLNELK